MVRCFLVSISVSNFPLLYKSLGDSSWVLAACDMVPPMNSTYLWLSSELVRIVDCHCV